MILKLRAEENLVVNNNTIFFSARERAEFNKSCNLIGSWSERNFLIRTATAGGIRRVDLFS